MTRKPPWSWAKTATPKPAPPTTPFAQWCKRNGKSGAFALTAVEVHDLGEDAQHLRSDRPAALEVRGGAVRIR
jgi:hypothetical protein